MGAAICSDEGRKRKKVGKGKKRVQLENIQPSEYEETNNSKPVIQQQHSQVRVIPKTKEGEPENQITEPVFTKQEVEQKEEIIEDRANRRNFALAEIENNEEFPSKKEEKIINNIPDDVQNPFGNAEQEQPAENQDMITEQALTTIYTCTIKELNLNYRNQIALSHDSTPNKISLPFLMTAIRDNEFWRCAILSKPYSCIPLLKEKETTFEEFLSKLTFRKLISSTDPEVLKERIQSLLQ
jgi:hypothetical protein